MVKVQIGSKFECYYISADGKKVTVAKDVDAIPNWAMSDGAALVKVQIGTKYECYYISENGKIVEIAKNADDVTLSKMSNGKAVVIIKKEGKYEFYFVREMRVSLGEGINAAPVPAGKESSSNLLSTALDSDDFIAALWMLATADNTDFIQQSMIVLGKNGDLLEKFLKDKEFFKKIFAYILKFQKILIMA